MKFSAVLLAGGESHRMGKDKATLLFHRKPLWQIQLELLRQTQPQEILISAQIDPAWRPANVLFMADKQPSHGPLSGLAATLNQIQTDHLLALAIDMPMMSSEYLRSLCAQIKPGCGILPMISARAEPLAAIYPKSAYPEFSEALTQSELSLQLVTRKLVESGKLAVIRVSRKDERFFRNLNEPADLY